MTTRAGELGAELERWRDPWQDPAWHRHLAHAALPRILATLDLLPAAGPESRLLELGAEPYLTSVCLDVAWPGTVTRANYFGTEARSGVQILRDEARPDAEKRYAYDCFNVEVDEFPYPDGRFDVVLFSELIEHLAMNPVWTLAEIHRVLRPGGHLVLTTPNGVSLDRLEALLRAESVEVDRYAPILGYGARHNREYQPGEVRTLLEATGFDVEVLTTRDLKPRGLRRRLARALTKRLLRRWSAESRDEHVFLRARRRPIFRWRFPERLFGNVALLEIVRHPWVEMGVNDAIQCGQGWEPLESIAGADGRRVGARDAALPGAAAVLRGVPGARAVQVRLLGLEPSPGGTVPGRISVLERGAAGALLGFDDVAVPTGRWSDVAIPLVRALAPGEQVSVVVQARGEGDLVVQRIAVGPV